MDDYHAWFFVDPSAVPERWRDRAIAVALVPLLPNEVDQILGGDRAVPQISSEDEQLAALVARGMSVPEIAAELGFVPRTVERRLARLREELGVASTGELATYLSRRGF